MITPQNYYSLNNKGLSQSKIKDYIIDPNYCYRKNISGEYVKETKQAWNVGDAIDNILTDAETMSEYVVLSIPMGEKDTYWMTKAGKQYKADIIASGKKVITAADYDLIINVSDAVDKTEVYQKIKKEYTFQEIVQIPMELGQHFDCLYGKIDAYKINDDGVCDLLDLKSTASLPVDLRTGKVSSKRYLYSALDYGYFIQLWFYAYLLRQKYSQIKSFRYWHLAVEKKEPYRVELFKISDYEINKWGDVVLNAIDNIKNDKTFNKFQPSFDDPSQLGEELSEDEFDSLNS